MPPVAAFFEGDGQAVGAQRPRRVVAQHTTVVEAICEHRPEDAREAMRVQPDGSFDLPVAWMQTQPSAT